MEQSGQQYGRLATCVRDHWVGLSQDASASSGASSSGSSSGSDSSSSSSGDVNGACKEGSHGNSNVDGVSSHVTHSGNTCLPDSSAPTTAEGVSLDQLSLSTPPPPPPSLSPSLSTTANKEIAAEIFTALSSWLLHSHSAEADSAFATPGSSSVGVSPAPGAGASLGPGASQSPRARDTAEAVLLDFQRDMDRSTQVGRQWCQPLPHDKKIIPLTP